MTYGFRGGVRLGGETGHQVAGMEQETESPVINKKPKADRKHWEEHEAFPPVLLHYLNLPNSATMWGPSVQTPMTVGGLFLIQTTTSSHHFLSERTLQ